MTENIIEYKKRRERGEKKRQYDQLINEVGKNKGPITVGEKLPIIQYVPKGCFLESRRVVEIIPKEEVEDIDDFAQKYFLEEKKAVVDGKNMADEINIAHRIDRDAYYILE